MTQLSSGEFLYLKSTTDATRAKCSETEITGNSQGCFHTKTYKENLREGQSFPKQLKLN